MGFDFLTTVLCFKLQFEKPWETCKPICWLKTLWNTRLSLLLRFSSIIWILRHWHTPLTREMIIIVKRKRRSTDKCYFSCFNINIKFFPLEETTELAFYFMYSSPSQSYSWCKIELPFSSSVINKSFDHGCPQLINDSRQSDWLP